MANSKLLVTISANDQITSKLNDVRKKFEQITQSGAPMKKQIRDIQKLLADLNVNKLTGDFLFTEMAEYAGNFADAIGDARTAVNAFAYDQFKLQVVAQGLTLTAQTTIFADTGFELFGEKLYDHFEFFQNIKAILIEKAIITTSQNQGFVIIR